MDKVAEMIGDKAGEWQKSRLLLLDEGIPPFCFSHLTRRNKSRKFGSGSCSESCCDQTGGGWGGNRTTNSCYIWEYITRLYKCLTLVKVLHYHVNRMLVLQMYTRGAQYVDRD